jgi:predicted metalloprotease
MSAFLLSGLTYASERDFVVQKLDHYSVLLCVPRHKGESSRERFSGGLEMTGALLFGAVCGFIIALIFAPIPSMDEKDQIEKAQKDQKEQIEKEQKERKEKIEKEQKEKSNNKIKFKQKKKSEQTDKSWSAMASKNEITFCIKNCPDIWRLHRE